MHISDCIWSTIYSMIFYGNEELDATKIVSDGRFTHSYFGRH